MLPAASCGETPALSEHEAKPQSSLDGQIISNEGESIENNMQEYTKTKAEAFRDPNILNYSTNM